MKKRTLSQKVYKSIRFDIVSGKIAGGTRITETDIAQSLKVSRTPVREALQKLAQEKLLSAIPKAGYLVEDLSDTDILDLFSARMEVEIIAFHKAIDFITVEEIKQLDDNLEETKSAIKAGEDFQLTQLDLDFHATIYKASRSKYLFRICSMLSDLTIRYRHALNLQTSLANEMLRHHLQIYQAVLAKDTDALSQALVLHAGQAQQYILGAMKKLRSESFMHKGF